ncbi:hypothetical protein Cni_G09928 [Canna indica]|uniref:Uncharacterized protein n=1 Tax=Canna indica TaxID=4628 RepID=A0AAQ3Q851_9LILI|nr:hypothetical protein Cni_G09928 [Canna indica]
MDNASYVCSDLPTASNLLHKARNDDETPHWKKLCDPSCSASECHYYLNHTEHALYDKLIIPFLRLLIRQEKGIGVLQRIEIGMCLSVVAMVIAAIVESKRIRILQNGGSHDVQQSIFWLLPQYILLGISDVSTVVGMQEFFYMEVPTTMRTIGIALYLSVFGVGSFLSAILISVLELVSNASGKQQSWFSDDAREARLDNYYWFLALLSSISFLIFAYLCKYYHSVNASKN